MSDTPNTVDLPVNPGAAPQEFVANMGSDMEAANVEAPQQSENVFIRGAQTIDRTLDPVKTERLHIGGRLGTKVAGALLIVGGVNGLKKLDRAPDVLTQVGMGALSYMAAVGGIGLLAAGMKKSGDRIHFEDRRTPAEIYRQRRMYTLDRKIMNVDHKEGNIKRKLESAEAYHGIVGDQPAFTEKARKNAKRSLETNRTIADRELPKLANRKTTLQTRHDTHKAKSARKAPAA